MICAHPECLRPGNLWWEMFCEVHWGLLPPTMREKIENAALEGPDFSAAMRAAKSFFLTAIEIADNAWSHNDRPAMSKFEVKVAEVVKSGEQLNLNFFRYHL